jgi:hypothetical protein
MKLQWNAAKAAKDKPTTTISFSAEDLRGLGQLVAAGQVMLQTSCPAVARLKAAMTRLQVPIPKGL